MKRRLCNTITVCAVVMLFTATSTAIEVRADEPAEAWRSSPFHGQKDSGTGLPIPCTCRFRDRDFRVGERACMHTPNHGVVIARCDLINNITSWVPTKHACTTS